VVLQKAGRSAEAADAFRKAAELDPNSRNAWLYAGILYEQNGAHDKAIPALTQALALGAEPKYQAHMALAQAYAHTNDSAKALDEFAAATQARPDDPIAWYDLAVLQTQTGKATDAVQSYRKVLDLKPTDAAILNPTQLNLGLLLAADGNTDAIPLLNAAIQTNATSEEPHVALGNLYARRGEPDKAIAERLIALQLNPKDNATHLQIGDALMAQKKWAEAAAHYEAVAATEPTRADVHNAAGTAYEYMGDMPKAQAAFQAALQANPKYAQAHNNMGVIYEKQGKLAQAKAEYKRAVALDPSLTEARKNLARFSAPATPKPRGAPKAGGAAARPRSASL
jgi:tetratricopeptide (TPR) repeat protein